MTPADRFKAALAELVERVMRRVDYFRLTPARVVRQASDGTLELIPDDGSGLPGLVGVPIRHGLPGVTGVSVASGARVRVGFEGGDPRLPYAALWDAGNVTRITINSGTRNAARAGDEVVPSEAMATWMTSVSAALMVTPTPTSLGTVTGGTDVVKLP